MADAKVFFVPTKPLTIIQGINRTAAATGSIRHAAAAHGADYNGHHNHLSWNNYRSYYVGEYFWAGRYVFTRNQTDFSVALDETLQEFDRQGAGATLKIYPRECDVPLAEAHPRLLLWSPEAEAASAASWHDWRFGEINNAIQMERQFGIPHLNYLIEASSLEEYKAKVGDEFAKRRRPAT